VHRYSSLPDELVHEDDRADVVWTAHERVQLQVGARPPRLVRLISAREEEVDDLVPPESIHVQLRLKCDHRRPLSIC
jgi:hypothetical protein